MKGAEVRPHRAAAVRRHPSPRHRRVDRLAHRGAARTQAQVRNPVHFPRRAPCSRDNDRSDFRRYPRRELKKAQCRTGSFFRCGVLFSGED